MMYKRTSCAALLVVTLSASTAHAADSFYLDLLREGIRSSELGRHQEAVRKLRISCFGFLDEPTLLARGLVRLALAQAAIDDQVGFRETFDRLAVVEERFDAYTEADLSAEARSLFEIRATAWVPAIERTRIPAFQATLVENVTVEPEAVAPRQLRKQLRKQLQSDPDNPDLLWRLAQLEWGDGRVRQTAPLVERLLSQDPAHQEALCLSGRIGETRRVCEAILSGLPSCTDLHSDAALAASYLGCLSERERWDAAQEFVTALDPATRGHNRVAQLVSALVVPESPLDSEPVSEQVESAVESVSGAEDQRALESQNVEQPRVPLEGLASRDRYRLEQVRQLLLTASRIEDLEAPQQMASDLLAAYPDSREIRFLAAEVAYRGSRWEEAIDHFRHVEPPGTEEALLLFYYSVSLFEGGARDEAELALRSALPLIERTPFVASYASRILASGSVED